jgi:hypothetical protein
MVDNPMTVGELRSAIKDLPDEMPILAEHHCAANLFYELSLEIRKIKDKKYLIINPDDSSEMSI